MVVAYVGFVGGYVKAVLGPDSLFLAGALAATVVTWFTFLPSFIFILAGGPFVESTHNDLKFTAPLTAITAAVVGVILNLALFFGYHTLWPKGFGDAMDVLSKLKDNSVDVIFASRYLVEDSGHFQYQKLFQLQFPNYLSSIQHIFSEMF